MAKTEQKTDLHLKLTELKQKQKFMNLETGVEDEVVVVTKRYSVPDGMDEKAAYAEAEKLVTPISNRTAALLNFIAQRSYQESKDAALQSGNYMSGELKSALVSVMQQLKNYSEASARDAYKAWENNYKGVDDKGNALEKAEATRRKVLAQKLLDRAKTILENEEFQSF